MSKKNYKDLEAELLLERKENKPEINSNCKGTILSVNSRGLFLDIAKSYEGMISKNELGSKTLDDYQIGDQIEFIVLGEDKNQEGVYRLSVKQIESNEKWKSLQDLKGKNLDLTITKVIKSGVEVQIQATSQIGFIPHGYLDSKQESLKDKKREEWVGSHIAGRIHELDQNKNKIILNNKVVSDELKEAKAKEIMSSISIGQEIEGTVVRIADFGIFVDIGGLDALVPSSELSWRRFKKPSDVVQVGKKVRAKIFKIEAEQRRVAMSVKQLEADPWTTLPADFVVGHKLKAKIVTHADFGAFSEVLPGVEALLHKSNFPDEGPPEIGKELCFEVINLDINKKRMGVKIIDPSNFESSQTKTNSEDQSGEEQTTTKAQEVVETVEKLKEEDDNKETKELEHV